MPEAAGRASCMVVAFKQGSKERVLFMLHNREKKERRVEGKALETEEIIFSARSGPIQVGSS